MRFLHSAEPPIIHADLKSANVMVDANFRGKVADFGLTGKQEAVGTPYFMAPELLRFHTINPSVSLGFIKKTSLLSCVLPHQMRRRKNVRSIRDVDTFINRSLSRAETSANTKSDVYAFGVTMFEIFTRVHPYDGVPFTDVMLV